MALLFSAGALFARALGCFSGADIFVLEIALTLPCGLLAFFSPALGLFAGAAFLTGAFVVFAFGAGLLAAAGVFFALFGRTAFSGVPMLPSEALRFFSGALVAFFDAFTFLSGVLPTFAGALALRAEALLARALVGTAF